MSNNNLPQRSDFIIDRDTIMNDFKAAYEQAYKTWKAEPSFNKPKVINVDIEANVNLISQLAKSEISSILNSCGWDDDCVEFTTYVMDLARKIDGLRVKLWLDKSTQFKINR